MEAMQDHYIYEKDGSSVGFYMLVPGVALLFNQIYQSSWERGNFFDNGNMLILNFCVGGRCDFRDVLRP